MTRALHDPKGTNASALTFHPIGVVRTPFRERVEAPRQPAAAPETPGRIELSAGMHFEDALADLQRWSHIWVIFAFHASRSWRPKVLPPRSSVRRGVFATRSPYRPNPIGMSVVALEKVDGLTLHVRGVDMLDGTPVLDLKPYVAYADTPRAANAGWLAEPDADPLGAYRVTWSEHAATQLEWLRERGLDLTCAIERALSLGPEPHAYRRIRREGDASCLAVKDWRAVFRQRSSAARHLSVEQLRTGYKPRELALREGVELDLHRAFVARFGLDGGR